MNTQIQFFRLRLAAYITDLAYRAARAARKSTQVARNAVIEAERSKNLRAEDEIYKQAEEAKEHALALEQQAQSLREQVVNLMDLHREETAKHIAKESALAEAVNKVGV
jgi:hypothetical protein